MKIIEMPCITCPMSCHLLVEQDEQGKVISVKGNTCPRGEAYARKELVAPERMVTTTIRIDHARYPLLPVITSKEVPKERIFDIMKACKNVRVQAPVAYGAILIENVAGLDVNILASRSMDEVREDGATGNSCN